MAPTDRDVVMTKRTNVFRMRAPAPPPHDDPPVRPTELRYRIEADSVATTIYLAGSMHEWDALMLRGILRRCLAETPSVIIVDLTGLVVADRDALAELGSVALDSAWWPGSELLIAGAPVPAHALFARHRVRFGRCFETWDEAFAAATSTPAPQRFREDLPPRQGTGRRVRRMIADACATWELAALVGAVHVAGAELVANATRHAGTDITLTLALRPCALHMAVRDGSHESPKIYGPRHPLARQPQGLLRVDAATDDWGVTELAEGKLVWASWNIPALGSA